MGGSRGGEHLSRTQVRRISLTSKSGEWIALLPEASVIVQDVDWHQGFQATNVDHKFDKVCIFD